jgi:very-short-patch-repair endonuclease
MKRKTTEQFIEESKLIHGDKYDYSSVNYINNKTNVKIICPIHGDFEQRPDDHLNGHGCEKCNDSSGEKTIINYLLKNNILFETQKRFNSCKNKRKLPFDFFIPSKNICIEFDGIQHFKPIKIWGGTPNLKYIQNNDKIKNKFCEDNGIKLIRIKYSENIENKLKKELEI